MESHFTPKPNQENAHASKAASRITSDGIKAMKGKQKIAVLTCYDATSASLMEDTVDVIMVGDSYGMVMLGYDNTLNVTMDDMIRATRSVVCGAPNVHVVGDMPAGSYDSDEEALSNAKKFLDEGALSVKIERKPQIAANLAKKGIPVMGHIGLTPQTVFEFRVQGKEEGDAERLVEEAKEMEKAGCYSLVLECIPESLAKKITESISIPTIGIGAGVHCDGQVLVMHDMLGIFQKFNPKFVKRYANLGDEMKKAFRQYSDEVKSGKFPDDAHSFH